VVCNELFGDCGMVRLYVIQLHERYCIYNCNPRNKEDLVYFLAKTEVTVILVRHGRALPRLRKTLCSSTVADQSYNNFCFGRKYTKSSLFQ
jgi:hypothetical protein